MFFVLVGEARTGITHCFSANICCEFNSNLHIKIVNGAEWVVFIC